MIDLQSTKGQHPIAICQAGIKGIKHPVRIADSNSEQATVADFSMGVSLGPEQRGTHMSRFVEILNSKEWVLSAPAMQELLHVTKDKLQSSNVNLTASFPLFYSKAAPVSAVSGLCDYHGKFYGKLERGKLQITQTVVVPVTTLCPCSKEISDYGAHNQRSYITVTITSFDVIYFNELIKIIEAEASCPVYSILKRTDEKYVTEYAYDNPRFVEDLVRNIAAKLNDDNRIDGYRIESENLESIHNHSAYALIDNL